MAMGLVDGVRARRVQVWAALRGAAAAAAHDARRRRGGRATFERPCATPRARPPIRPEPLTRCAAVTARVRWPPRPPGVRRGASARCRSQDRPSCGMWVVSVAQCASWSPLVPWVVEAVRRAPIGRGAAGRRSPAGWLPGDRGVTGFPAILAHAGCCAQSSISDSVPQALTPTLGPPGR